MDVTQALDSSSLIFNLLAERLTDFEIRTGSYVFKVHRVIMASASKYFERICAAGQFKETIEGFVTVEIEPKYMAALILGTYVGVDNTESSSPVLIQRIGQKILQNASKDSPAELYNFDAEYTTVMHAKMFGYAEYYHLDDIRDHAAKKYLELIKSPQITINELLSNIEILYDEAKTASEILKGPVVYMAQRIQRQIVDLPKFEALIRTYPDFAWDFSSKFYRAIWIWCPECESKIVLAECQCGFSGVCGYKYCTKQDLTEMLCTTCDRRGHMLKTRPEMKVYEAELVEKSVDEVMHREMAYEALVGGGRKRKTGRH